VCAVLTQTTAGDEPGSSVGSGLTALIRWVFPLPSQSASWLERAEAVIGRDPECDVRLDGARVSRRHARFARSGPLWLLTDLDSKNGVSLNGRRVKSAALSAGDVIRIGDFVGVFLLAPLGSDLALRDLGSGILGGAAHREAERRLRVVAASNLPVVIEGATGTGKERFAKALHEWSGRRGSMLAVNCSVYSRSVAAGELFGYRKGAFTGASQSNAGHIRAAEGGTLFLDELIELPLEVQAMLLRVIENREVLALGESRPVSVDVRFVAATQLPLSRAVASGQFRADLRARLEGAVVSLPTLAECKEIIPELFSALFEQYAGVRPTLSANFAERLCLHDWPLNIRELEMLSRRLSKAGSTTEPLPISALDCLVSAEDASSQRTGTRQSGSTAVPRVRTPVPGRRSAYDDSQLRALLEALVACEGNLSRAAEAIGVSRPRAYRMLDAANKAGLVT